MELIVRCKRSKKGSLYKALCLVKDEREFILTFDKFMILRVSGMTIDAFDNMVEDSVYTIGNYVKK